MPKRHTMRAGDWESIFLRLEELVMANSGENLFEEVFKLLVVKLYCELNPEKAISLEGQTACELKNQFNSILAKAAHYWKGILPTPVETRLTDEHLKVCFQVLHGLKLSGAGIEVMDSGFEFLISRDSKGAKGQYFTPRYVIDCCVRMVSPNAEDTIVDPACGSGGFLIHALQLVQDCKGIKDLKGYCQNHLWGFDFDSRAVQVAKALMLIAGDGNCNILHLNSLARSAVNQELFKLPSSEVLPSLTIEDVLRSTRKRFTGFDIVLTNPPFAGEIREPNILETYELAANHTRIERDILFLERCIELLRPGGRLCIVLPHNKFAGSNWKYAREWLAERLRIVGVLSLGRNTFLPHTHQKTNVLFGIKRSSSEKPNKGERIIFMVSEKDAKDSRGQILERPKVNSDDPAWVRADHDLNTLVERFHKFVKEERISWGTR